jgi:hypothetical protein
VVFKNIPPINSTFKESEVKEWKLNPKVKKSYDILFKKSSRTRKTYMSKIVNNIWKDKKNISKVQIAYALSVCKIFLDPQVPFIIAKEEILKPMFLENLVNFLNTCKFTLIVL